MSKLLRKVLIFLLSIGFVFSIACADDSTKTTANLNIKENNVQVYVGETYQLNIEKTAISGKVEYLVEHPFIASVSDNGLITGLSEGSTIVTIKSCNLQDSCRVDVVNKGASIEEFPFISVVSDNISVSLDGSYIIYPELFLGEEKIENTAFNATVSGEEYFTATVDGNMIKVNPVAVGSSTLTISVDYNGNIIEKLITVNVLESVGEISVTGYITESGICSVDIQGISGQTARVYFGDTVVSAMVYPDSINFTLSESEMILLDGKNIGDEINITIFGDNGKVYTTKIKVFAVEKYQGSVYLQPNGQIKGLSGYDAVTFAGKNFELNTLGNNTFVSGEEWLSVKNSLSIGETINGSVTLDQKIVEIPIKYITLAISNYEELTQIENGSVNYYVLANDIDCNGQQWENKDRTEFASIFDGNGYAIRNLTIANTSSTQYNGYSDNTFIGMHGWKCKFITQIGENAVIKNVVFDGLKSYGDITKTALFGRNAGLIENVVVSIAAPTIDGFGGFVGDNAGTIKNCVLDYTVQDKWVMGYIATTNGGTIENVLVNIPENFVQHNFKLIGTDNGTSTGIEQVVKTKAQMIELITDLKLKELYKKVSVNALNVGAKTEIDFNGKTVNGYVLNLSAKASFNMTDDYISDLKSREIVGVKIWVKVAEGNYIYVVPNATGGLGGAPRDDWQTINGWTSVSIGRNYSKEDDMPSAQYSWVYSNDVITPDQLSLFSVYVTGNAEYSVYIDEFTAETVPVISGKEFTTSNIEVGGETVTAYRVEFNSNNTITDKFNAPSGFMLSQGYLDSLKEQGYNSITLMMKTDGLACYAVGYRIGDEDWNSSWINGGKPMTDWTEVNDNSDNMAFTLEEAKDLHIFGTSDAHNGNAGYPTYIKFYIVAHK